LLAQSCLEHFKELFGLESGKERSHPVLGEFRLIIAQLETVDLALNPLLFMLSLLDLKRVLAYYHLPPFGHICISLGNHFFFVDALAAEHFLVYLLRCSDGAFSEPRVCDYISDRGAGVRMIGQHHRHQAFEIWVEEVGLVEFLVLNPELIGKPMLDPFVEAVFIGRFVEGWMASVNRE